MVNTKGKEKIAKVAVFAYLIIFPFGQLLRVNFPLIDYIVLIFPILFLLNPLVLTNIYKKLFWFVGVCLFTFFLSLPVFYPDDLTVGFMYLARLFSYICFSVIIWKVFQKDKEKILVLNSLIAISLFVAIFGLVQYLIFPDMRVFTVWGWDDHFGRLVGTFFDPGFVSIILSFGILLLLLKFREKKNYKLLPILVILLAAMFLTYSRAGYLALLAGSIILLKNYLKAKVIVFILTVFVVILFILPKFSSEGTNLLRTASIQARFTNYFQSIELIKKFPLFGVGYNNICIAKMSIQKIGEKDSHSCSGADNSFLLVWATTGIAGLFIFLDVIVGLVRGASRDIYGNAFLATGTALLVNSFFVNSLFYSWVMGWMAILIALSRNSIGRS